MKKKISLLCAAMLFLFGDMLIEIGGRYFNLFPGFLGFLFLYLLGREYEKESMLARILKPLCLVSIFYSMVFYAITAADYAWTAETFYGNVLALVEVCLQLAACYLMILTLQNTAVFRKKEVSLTYALAWFALTAFASVGIFFTAGVMAVASGIIQRVGAIGCTVCAAKVIAAMEKM